MSRPIASELPIFANRQKIQEMIGLLGSTLLEKFRDKPLTVIINLDGAVIFARDLLECFEEINDVRTIAVKVKSYHGTESSGKPKISLGLNGDDLQGRHAIIVDDIADSGLTAKVLWEMVSSHTPESITFVTLIDKPHCHPDLEIPINSCFTYDGGDFFIGFGLDYNEEGRSWPNLHLMPRPQEQATIGP